MKIINYRKRYLDQVLELNKKIVKVWYDYSNGDPRRSTWEKLTPKGRFYHGGPWNDPDTLNIHLNGLISIGKVHLLVDDSDNVLGMAESHNIDNKIHLDWILTDPERRNMGIARKLIGSVKSAYSGKYKELWTEPEEDTEGFYKNLGFTQVNPSYMRYMFSRKTGVSDQFEEIAIKDIKLSRYLGEANNSKKYLLFLLKTNLQYTEIFEDPYPFYAKYSPSYSIITRSIASLPFKKSVFITGEYEDCNLDDLADNLTKPGSYFLSLLSESINWDIFRQIKRLKLKLM